MLSCLPLVNLSFIGKTKSWGHNCDSLEEAVNRQVRVIKQIGQVCEKENIYFLKEKVGNIAVQRNKDTCCKELNILKLRSTFTCTNKHTLFRGKWETQ